MIHAVGHLLDQPLANERPDNHAQRCAFDLEHLQQVALHRWPVMGQVVQHIPLGGPEVVRLKGGLHCGTPPARLLRVCSLIGCTPSLEPVMLGGCAWLKAAASRISSRNAGSSLSSWVRRSIARRAFPVNLALNR